MQRVNNVLTRRAFRRDSARPRDGVAIALLNRDRMRIRERLSRMRARFIARFRYKGGPGEPCRCNRVVRDAWMRTSLRVRRSRSTVTGSRPFRGIPFL